MHDQEIGEGKVAHASSSLQTGCVLEWEKVGDFASSWKHGVRKVANVVSLTLLVRVEDFGGSWRYGESGGVRALEPGEMVTSEVAFYDGRWARPRGMKEGRFVST